MKKYKKQQYNYLYIYDFKKFGELTPTNLLPVVEKVMETLVHKQINEYVKKNTIFHESQFEFSEKSALRKCLSTCVFQVEKHIDDGNTAVSVFEDL